MASLLLNAAPVDYQDNININNNLQQNNFSKKQSKNKTIKNDNIKKIKAEMLKNNFELSDDDDDENNDLENFKPVQEQNLKKDTNSQNINQENLNQENHFNSSNNNDAYVSDYYKNYLKTLDANRNIESISNNELLKKLDNILYLLEDQTEEKNSYVTEELILYIFLGIFVIYVLDSFVRVGKYTR